MEGRGQADRCTTEPAEARPFVPLLPYQREDVESDARFRRCCWARQTGKSFTKSLRRLLRGLKRGRTQVFLSAGERQSAELMQKVRQHCQALKIAHDFVGDHYFERTSFRQLEVGLPNGVRIIGLPANPQTARGFTGDVLLDEFGDQSPCREADYVCDGFPAEVTACLTYGPSPAWHEPALACDREG